MSAIHAIIDFTLHGSSGLSVLNEKWITWVLEHQNKPGFSQENAYGLGRVTHVTWRVDGRLISVPIEEWSYCKTLPDASGFICFESEWKPDNCTLLDAYGKERMRLTVPWQLTGSTNPDSGQPPTSFENISEPYINPADGIEGKFGVTAWVEYAGKYYFEFDYHTGQFLWCKRIMD